MISMSMLISEIYAGMRPVATFSTLLRRFNNQYRNQPARNVTHHPSGNNNLADFISREQSFRNLDPEIIQFGV